MLSECRHNEIGVHNCRTRSEEAGVMCNLTFPHSIHSMDSSGQQCNETDVRLVNGLHEGQVELCLNGVWYSVCSNGWDVNDARVVCRQLGYDGRKYYTFGYESPALIISITSLYPRFLSTATPSQFLNGPHSGQC